MEDIDRIEIIRGPGAALWGANAVNGVINVITKKAQDTRGFLVSAGGGSQEGYGAVRYGGQSGDNLSYRVFGKYDNTNNFAPQDGGSAFDAWNIASGGFRLDWAKDANSWSLLGGAYRGETDTSLRQPSSQPPYVEVIQSTNQTTGVNLLGRWTRSLGLGNDLSLQAYFDRFERDQPTFYFETRNTFDLELQHGFVAGRNDVVWGGRYRYTHDDLPPGPNVSWNPQQQADKLGSVFLQDRIALGGDAFRLTVGSKFEHNDYTGFEIQPNARFTWMPGNDTLWAAVSRAVRTPARYEHTFNVRSAVVPTPLPGLLGVVTIDGNPDFVSEEVLDYEVGFRAQPTERFSFDLVGFYNQYHHLSSVEPNGMPTLVPGPVPYVDIRQTFRNLTHGSGYGTELVANLLPVDPWQLQVSYSYLRLDLESLTGSQDQNVHGPEGNFPQNQFRVQSYLDLSRHFQLDANLQYVDGLPNLGTPSYTRFDTRFAWRPGDGIELALVGQNLFDDRHLEFNQSQLPAVASLVERSVLVQILWRR